MFKFEVTEDGSPTLRIGRAEAAESDGKPLGEAMHSLKGAFSETVYIYGHAIKTCLARGFEPRVLSVGLGLGYVEILSAGLFIKSDCLAQASGESLEILPELRDRFRGWLLGLKNVPEEFANAYEEILQRTARELDIPAVLIYRQLAEMVRDGRWIISEELTERTSFSRPFACICFDAFSAKTSPDLWNEEFLKNFLTRAAQSGCVLATYACTGALKRSLQARGFDLEIREGFSNKRDSTFAIRTPETRP